MIKEIIKRLEEIKGPRIGVKLDTENGPIEVVGIGFKNKGFYGYEIYNIVEADSRRVLETVKSNYVILTDENSGPYIEFENIEPFQHKRKVMSFSGTGRELKKEVEAFRKLAVKLKVE